jgi:GTP-binding protein
MTLDFSKTEFLRAASCKDHFLRGDLPQIAFAGRSNVGKSSVINRLTGRVKLAYVGSTPGKTAQINYFGVSGKAYLVDLPGYGYAKVSHAERERWAKLMESYFQDETGLITTGVLIVDIRHKPTADDVTMHNWFRETGCPEIVVANKHDKLKASQVEPALALIRETLEMSDDEELIPFSAEKGTGREQLIRSLSAACQRAE